MRTCNEPRLVERRLSFTVKVTTASGNWKHSLPLKIIFMSVSNGYRCRSGWHLTPPTLRHARATKVWSHVLYIHVYIYLRFPLFRPISVSLASLASLARQLTLSVHARECLSFRRSQHFYSQKWHVLNLRYLQALFSRTSGKAVLLKCILGPPHPNRKMCLHTNS